MESALPYLTTWQILEDLSFSHLVKQSEGGRISEGTCRWRLQAVVFISFCLWRPPPKPFSDRVRPLKTWQTALLREANPDNTWIIYGGNHDQVPLEYHLKRRFWDRLNLYLGRNYIINNTRQVKPPQNRLTATYF